MALQQNPLIGQGGYDNAGGGKIQDGHGVVGEAIATLEQKHGATNWALSIVSNRPCIYCCDGSEFGQLTHTMTLELRWLVMVQCTMQLENIFTVAVQSD